VGLYVSQSQNDGMVRFEVHDTGIGLTAQQQKKLFEPFTQAHETATRMYGGTGLGLTILKQLVELMNGKIWIESTLEAGSKFIFEIVLDEI
jgi:signal transduction histidine kinase